MSVGRAFVFGAAAIAGCSLALDGTRPDDGGAADAGPIDATSDGADDASDAGGGADAAIDTACAADTTSDPANCGKCGHDCLGGACASGQCQPVTLLSGLKDPRGLAVSGQKLLWTSPSLGTINALQIGTTTQQVMVPDAGTPTYLAIAGGDLYWTNDVPSTGWVAARTIPNGPNRTIAANQNDPVGIAVIGATVYFTLQSDDSIAMALADGGAAIVVGGGLDFPEMITADGNGSMYVAAPGGEIFRADLDGSAPVTLASGFAKDWPAGIALDNGELYFTLRDTGRVARMKKTGGAVETIATGQASPTGIALDATAIYWANNGSGTIMRLAR